MKANSVRLFHIEMPSESEPVEDAPPPVRTTAPEELAPRVRKTTVDVFNDEMSVLDRPLEGEVEYYDEPKPRRWKVPAIGLAIFMVSCAGGYLAFAHGRAPSARPTLATAPLPPAATAADPPAPPVVAPAPAPVANADPGSTEHRHHHARRTGSEHHHHASRAARHGRG